LGSWAATWSSDWVSAERGLVEGRDGGGDGEKAGDEDAAVRAEWDDSDEEEEEDASDDDDEEDARERTLGAAGEIAGEEAGFTSDEWGQGDRLGKGGEYGGGVDDGGSGDGWGQQQRSWDDEVGASDKRPLLGSWTATWSSVWASAEGGLMEERDGSDDSEVTGDEDAMVRVDWDVDEEDGSDADCDNDTADGGEEGGDEHGLTEGRYDLAILGLVGGLVLMLVIGVSSLIV
jgi:hypothetical protein